MVSCRCSLEPIELLNWFMRLSDSPQWNGRCVPWLLIKMRGAWLVMRHEWLLLGVPFICFFLRRSANGFIHFLHNVFIICCSSSFHHVWSFFIIFGFISHLISQLSSEIQSQAPSAGHKPWATRLSFEANWKFHHKQTGTLKIARFFSEWKCGWNVDGSKFSLKNHTHLPAIFGASPGHQATRAPSAAILVGRWAPGRVSCGALGARGHGTVGDWTAWPWHPGDCLWHFWWLKWASAWKRWCFFWSWRLDDSCWLDDLSQC